MSLDFTPLFEGSRELLQGTFVTIQVTVSSFCLSLLFGVILGICRLDVHKKISYAFASAYIVFFRGTPLLVQLFVLYFGLPQIGVLMPAFLCAVFGLGFYSAAYVAEIVRGAIQSIDQGQWEVAYSLGFSRASVIWNIILPQAFLRMIPPLGNEMIALIKNSALVSLLTLDDVMREGQRIISVSFHSLEVYLGIALIYLVLTALPSYFLRRLELKLKARGFI